GAPVAAAILDRYPTVRAVIYDQAHVLERARRRFAGSPDADRVELIAGSFFDSVPEGGDWYVLKHIVHDWSDDLAIDILRNCRRAMKDGARLVLIESVIEPGNAPHFGKFLDLEMLAITEGG